MAEESPKVTDLRQAGAEQGKVGNVQPATGDGQRAAPLRAGANIADRLLSFAADALRLSARLQGSPVGRHLALQLARSATGAGANYEEARAAESAADFAHKTAVAAKEVREATYWVRLIARSGLSSGDDSAIIHEATELSAILAACVRTARQRSHPRRTP